MGAFDPINGQGGKIPRFPSIAELPQKLINMGLQAAAQAMQFRFGGLLTYEKPVTEFFADILVPVSSLTTLRAGTELPRNCVSVRFIDVVGAPYISINGGGARKLLNNDSILGTEIHILQIGTGAGDSCTVQAAGTGD